MSYQLPEYSVDRTRPDPFTQTIGVSRSNMELLKAGKRTKKMTGKAAQNLQIGQFVNAYQFNTTMPTIRSQVVWYWFTIVLRPVKPK